MKPERPAPDTPHPGPPPPEERESDDLGAEKRELWKRAALAYISAANATEKTRAATWADEVVRAYEERRKDGRL